MRLMTNNGLAAVLAGIAGGTSAMAQPLEAMPPRSGGRRNFNRNVFKPNGARECARRRQQMRQDRMGYSKPYNGSATLRTENGVGS